MNRISLLVPFKADNSTRQETWDWLRRYWLCELPGVEIVEGHSARVPFSKTEAVNDAASRASGSIFVILDADSIVPGETVRHCADAIGDAAERGRNLWFIPYRRLYRLTRAASERMLVSPPCHPYRFPSPPDRGDVESQHGSGASHRGHWFGAMAQILPRVAFKAVGGMDPRFNGWGGEDIAFVRAVDTLWGKHKTARGDVLHLWHENIGDSFATRMWQGQQAPGTNNLLASRYNAATGDRAAMRQLVDEAHLL